ncbi:hypothetical protein EJB05_06056 [Eragrostis curvula]|uniref:DNA-directed RNA polymerase III subunit RPC9 n=1 Tax=Eragrostis curvula TaxID=38414 RepID=A0A5J9WEZ3_9POAL|nr:hypothetical protein EJB05_06056 [Eragrostis curvula]
MGLECLWVLIMGLKVKITSVHYCSVERKQMLGSLQTLKFLTSCDQEEPKQTPWDVWELFLPQNVYEYLLKTPACNQTRESIYEFVKRSEGFRLAEADKLNVINWRPSSAADAYAMIEECGRRFSRDERGEACDEDERIQELLDLVEEVLPLPPKAEAMQE